MKSGSNNGQQSGGVAFARSPRSRMLSTERKAEGMAGRVMGGNFVRSNLTLLIATAPV